MNDIQQRKLLTDLKALRDAQVKFRRGEITDDDPLSVALGGATESYVDIQSLVAVNVGDQVACLTIGGRDLVVLGTLGEAGADEAPTLSNVTLGTGSPTNTQTWSRVGRVVHVDGMIVLGTGGALTGDPVIALPVAADHATMGVAYGADSSTGAREAGVCIASSSSLVIRLPAALSASSPWTWAAGDSINYQITYQAA